MPKIPKFKNENEEAEFWGTHDLTDYLDEFEEVTEEIIVKPQRRKKKLISIRIDEDIIATLKIVADKKRIPYQTMIKTWLVEKLNSDYPEMLA